MVASKIHRPVGEEYLTASVLGTVTAGAYAERNPWP
jgi:hypothetical protein